MAHLALSLLGTFQAYLDGQHLTRFESNKARALLAFLVMEVDRPHSRAQLAGLLWPDWSESAARAHLRHALANLRQLLGDGVADVPFLLVTRSTLQFNADSDCQIDAVQISKGLALLQTPHVHSEELHQIEEAIALYHSRLLDDFFLDGCAAFEEWVLLTRERLQRQVLEALRLLTDHFTAGGNYRQAIAYAQQWVELEPWQEEAHVALMRLLVLNGQRSTALAQYERCRRILHEELGIAPTTETQALAERIRAAPGGMPSEGQEYKVEENEAFHQPLARPAAALAHESPTLPVPKYNLPAQLTPLVGRAKEIGAIQGLFHAEGARLVTLTGSGGIGKTRLAVQVAQELRHEFPDGMYFVALAPVREPTFVISAIAQVLDVHEAGSRPLLERIQLQLQDAVTLLLLDNFEHVVEAAPLVSQLLASCAHLKVLVTSRERLRLRGEFEYSVPPLSLPTHPGRAGTEGLTAFAAVELFRQRAVAAKPGFVLDGDNTAVVAQLCARLDGVPLAIELAAARLKLFSPQALLQRLTATGSASSLRFLAAGMRDAPDRHRSLWNAIDWSYDLLNAEEQAMFQRMAVFVGGCTLAAVAKVCMDNPATELLDRISSLVDKSLVLQEEDADGELRFGMLETLREFGLECLQESGELETIQRRYAEYYVALAEDADQHMETPRQLVWLARLDAEHSNLRAALLWATQNRELNLSLRLGAALPRFWLRRGHHQEAYRRLITLIQQWQGQAPRTPLEDVLFFAGLFAIRIVDLKAAQNHFEQSAEISRRTGNLYRLSYALELTGYLKHEQGDYASADALHEEGLQLSYQVEDIFGIAMALSRRGRMLAERGRLIEGRRLCEYAIALHKEIGDKWGDAIAFRNFGLVRRLQSDFVEAQTLFEKTFCLSQELGDKSTIAQAQYDLGCVRVDQGDLTSGRQFLHEALNLYFQIDSRSKIADALDALARVAAAQHQPERTLRLASAAAVTRAAVGFVRAPLLQAEVNQVLQAARQSLGEHAGTRAWNEGAKMTMDEAVAYALME